MEHKSFTEKANAKDPSPIYDFIADQWANILLFVGGIIGLCGMLPIAIPMIICGFVWRKKDPTEVKIVDKKETL